MKQTGVFFQKKAKGGKINLGGLLVKKTKSGKAGRGKIIQKLPGA